LFSHLNLYATAWNEPVVAFKGSQLNKNNLV